MRALALLLLLAACAPMPPRATPEEPARAAAPAVSIGGNTQAFYSYTR